MGMTVEMAQDLADMFDVNGHDVSVLDLLDCLCDIGLTLRVDNDGEAGRLYTGMIQRSIDKRKAQQ